MAYIEFALLEAFPPRKLPDFTVISSTAAGADALIALYQRRQPIFMVWLGNVVLLVALQPSKNGPDLIPLFSPVRWRQHPACMRVFSGEAELRPVSNATYLHVSHATVPNATHTLSSADLNNSSRYQ